MRHSNPRSCVPPVDRPARAADGHALMKCRESSGKIILTPWLESAPEPDPKR
ncbi:MAG: hypothetical protein QOJ15_10901 [Bradyrhizobium sp.]|jgi:hypothetical protein|nr:hypothetical protein [Bradyrhizobium sp.]